MRLAMEPERLLLRTDPLTGGSPIFKKPSRCGRDDSRFRTGFLLSGDYIFQFTFPVSKRHSAPTSVPYLP